MAIQLILSDVDGVMTDGGITFDSAGVETKTFNIRDGQGIRLWQKAGGKFGIVTGRKSEIVARRAKELDIEIVEQGVADKLPVVRRIAEEQNVSLDEIAYIGDDLPDVPVIRAVSCGVAVADAAAEVHAAADYACDTPGGRGAVREMIEWILKDADKWDEVVRSFTS